MQSPGTDVLRPFVNLSGDAGDLQNRIFPKLHMNFLGFEQSRVLLDQRVLGLRQDTDKVFFAQRTQLHTDRKPALKLRNQIRRPRSVKSSGRDEKDMVSLDHAILRVYGGALDNRQQISLHSLPRYIRPMRRFPAGDLVDLIKEDDSGLLDSADRLTRDFIHVDEL